MTSSTPPPASVPPGKVSLDEATGDRAATIRDLEYLRTITKAMYQFIHDSHGEDRRSYKADLFKYEALIIRADNLLTKIDAHIAKESRKEHE